MAEPKQTYSRWFTEWPSTHERAGQTVEVIAVEAVADLVEKVLDRAFEKRLYCPIEALAAPPALTYKAPKGTAGPNDPPGASA